MAKLVPKDPGAGRELLFVELSGIRNVIPIIDSGETDDHWILVMPRAEQSLRDRLDAGAMTVEEALAVMKDVGDALVDLAGRVVHRDIKPENTLWLCGNWCIGDFGISRYAEATTATDTRKYAFTAAYAAPERWLNEHATAATDVYSFGVMSYEILSGMRPFCGSLEDLREAHLHQVAPNLDGLAPALSALVAECMAKAPGARPSAKAVCNRLVESTVANRPKERSGLARLQETNLLEVENQRRAEIEASKRRSAEDRRKELVRSSQTKLEEVSMALYDGIVSSASASEAGPRAPNWRIRLAEANLFFGPVSETSPSPWLWEAPAFEVIAHATVSVQIPVHRNYGGRSHSLWYCDAQEEGKFQWFETAFMVSPLIAQRGVMNPFALDPGEEAAQALWRGLGGYEVAWPFEAVHANILDAFIDRWAAWFADGASGGLSHPSHMPERSTEGSWRT